MFGLGIGEILVILVIALIVFGPERLPDLARTLGRTVADLRRTMDDLKHEISSPMQEVRKEIDAVKRTAMDQAPPPSRPQQTETIAKPESLPEKTEKSEEIIKDE